MQTITWKHTCFICHRPINRGKPIILFATDKPMTVGVCHSTCGATEYLYGHFRTCPPECLSEEQVSFLAQFYYKLYSLPGGEQPNRELRICLAEFLHNYPESMANPLALLNNFLERYKLSSMVWLYHGDLERDFVSTLGEIQKAAKADPIDTEIDFRD
jgi:hypothetical protein